MIDEIAGIQNFIVRLRNFEGKLVCTRLKEDVGSITKLFKEYAPIDERIARAMEHTAPEYNVFDILHIKRYETKVHTPFLKHLLNPYESHKQKRLFFDSFMEMVLGNAFTKENVSHIEVYEEYSFSNGRIDILIFYQEDRVRKSMIIENKIDHHDEERQLERYYEFLVNECSYEPSNMHLVYLKPYKSPPSSTSISVDLYKKLKDNRSITELGYHENIHYWIESLLHEVKAPVVHQTLSQYLKTIKSL